MSKTGDSTEPAQDGSAHQQIGLDDSAAAFGEPDPARPREWHSAQAKPAESLLSADASSSAEWQSCLDAARAGCRDSQAALFSAVRQQLVSVAKQGIGRRLQPKVDGSDVVQQTLMDAVFGMAAFRGKTRAELVAWLKGILAHRLADTRRHYSGRQKRSVTREVSLCRTPTTPDDATSPSGRAMRHESEARLEQALRQLPEPYEHVIRLRNQLNLTLTEVAVALDCSPQAASKRWARAVRRLREELNRDDSAS